MNMTQLRKNNFIRLFVATLLLLIIAGSCLACNVQAYKNDDNIAVKEEQVENEVENPIRMNLDIIISIFIVTASILIMALVLVIEKRWDNTD